MYKQDNMCDECKHAGNPYWPAIAGHLPCLVELGCEQNEFAYVQAAANGHVHILQYLHAHQCPYKIADAMDAAARRGHDNVLTYLEPFGTSQSLINHVTHFAAIHAQPDTLRWGLYRNGIVDRDKLIGHMRNGLYPRLLAGKQPDPDSTLALLALM